MKRLKQLVHRPISSATVTAESDCESTDAPVQPDALSNWESEGGSLDERPGADLATTSNLLSRGGEAIRTLAAATWRYARRARLKLEVRQLESKVNSEKDAIGHLLFPLIEAGALQVSLPDVDRHLETIGELRVEIQQRRTIENIDRNATSQASAAQSASDVSAKASQSPAEQGGQG